MDKKGRERREGRGIKREKRERKRLTTDWVYSRNSYQLTFELRAMLLLVT